MFTGIIKSVGYIVGREPRHGVARLTIETADLDMEGVVVGSSIAVSGVCLTAVAVAPHQFQADVSHETLAVTTLGRIQTGNLVNLERPLRPDGEFGGHIVLGHVDGIADAVIMKPDGTSQRWTFEVADALARYLACKGSVTIDGVSLTVNEVDGNRFGVNLIPHTIAHTTFSTLQTGHRVNVEVDVVARYIERMLPPIAAVTDQAKEG